MTDYTQRCLPADLEDIHVLLRGTSQLLEVCEKPNMYSQARVMIACNTALNQTAPTYNVCVKKSEKSMQQLKLKLPANDPQSTLQRLRRGALLRDMCW